MMNLGSEAHESGRSIGMALLHQDVSHAAKIREHLAYQAKLEGLLRLAAQVLTSGDAAERADVAGQIQIVLDCGE
jgi:hypothetical protein